MNLDIAYINLIHTTLIGPLLFYIGIKSSNGRRLPRQIVGALSLLIPVLMKRPEMKLNYTNIIKIVHYGIYIPFLLYLALKEDLSDNIYKITLYLGLIVICYHAYKTYQRRDRLPFKTK